jgi:hypothetical protein
MMYQTLAPDAPLSQHLAVTYSRIGLPEPYETQP